MQKKNCIRGRDIENMYCKNCGKPIDGMNFCQSCGTPVEAQAKINLTPAEETPKQTEEAPKTVKKSIGKKTLLLTASALVIIVLVGAAAFFIGSKHNVGGSANIDKPSAAASAKDDGAKIDKPEESEAEQGGTDAEEAEYIDGYIDWLMPERATCYDSEGSILSREWIMYVPDANGCLLSGSAYLENGLWTFEVTENSFVIGWEAEGTKHKSVECTYDDDGNILSGKKYDDDGSLRFHNELIFDADGNISSKKRFEIDEIYEQIYDINGNVTLSKTYELDGTLIFWSEYTYDPNGNPLGRKSYDAAGNLRSWSECLYDIIGNVLYRKSYGDDEASNTWSKLIYDDNGNVCRHEYYDDDGDLTSWNEYMYDTYGNVLNIKEYGDEGGVGRWNEYTYAYTYDNAGNVLSCQREKYIHQGPMYQEVGIVSHETEMYTFDANGKMLSESYYDGEGFPHECIYSADGNILSRKYYNIDGTLNSWCEYTYDDIGNMLNNKEYGRDGELLERTEYVYTLERVPAWLVVLEELF